MAWNLRIVKNAGVRRVLVCAALLTAAAAAMAGPVDGSKAVDGAAAEAISRLDGVKDRVAVLKAEDGKETLRRAVDSALKKFLPKEPMVGDPTFQWAICQGFCGAGNPKPVYSSTWEAYTASDRCVVIGRGPAPGVYDSGEPIFVEYCLASPRPN